MCPLAHSRRVPCDTSRALALVLALTACTRAPPPPRPRADVPSPPPSPAPATDATTPADSLRAALARYAVDDDRPWRRELYSWAPPARAAEMVRTGSPLTSTPRSGGSPSPFSLLLMRLRQRPGLSSSIAAALLEDPSLSRYRYAWASAFPTARGFQGVSYGASLVRLVLRDEALILRLDPRDPQVFRLYDSAQREVPIERFAREKARVGAVYHVRRHPEVPVSFREYVACNGAMLASWSIATASVCAELDHERSLVVQAHAVGFTPERAPDRFWRGASTPPASPATAWAMAMATAAGHYLPTPSLLQALAASIATCETSVVKE